MHVDRTHHSAPGPQVGDSHATNEGAARNARAARTKRSRDTASSAAAWVASRDGLVAHERAIDDLDRGRVQHLDHAEFLEAFEAAWVPAKVEWTVTDEFTRRYARLGGRSRRDIGAALTAFLERLADTPPHAFPKRRAGLQIERMSSDDPVPDAWSLAWSSAGRATYLLEWRRTESGPVVHVTWLAIGPHGAPDRRRWRGSA